MPKYYAVAYSNGTNKTFSNWPEAERAVKGRGDVRFKKFNNTKDADAWGKHLAFWLKKRISILEILSIENEFDRIISEHDPRLIPLPN